MKTLHVAAVEPRQLGQELLAALENGTSLEFQPLFDRVYASMKERHLAHGGEENLRLTAYEVLRRLVAAGCVEKVEKRYRRKPGSGDPLIEHAAAEHCRELLAALQSAPEQE